MMRAYVLCTIAYRLIWRVQHFRVFVLRQPLVYVNVCVVHMCAPLRMRLWGEEGGWEGITSQLVGEVRNRAERAPYEQLCAALT